MSFGLLVIIALAAAVFLTSQAVLPRSEVARGGCAVAPTAGQPGAQPSKTATNTVKLREGQLTRADFGRSLTAKDVTAYLDLTGPVANPATPLFTRVDTFRRTDDGRLRKDDIVARAEISGPSVILTVCFGRVHDHLGDPGTYDGSVTIDDARLSAAVTIPFSVTMQYPHAWVVGWLFLALFPGIWVLWVLHTNRKQTSRAIDGKLLRWLLSVEGVVSVTVGGVAAAGVFFATYLRDLTWGSNSLQPISLFGAMFSAFITAAGATQIKEMAKGSSGDNAGDKAGDDHAAGG